MALLSEHEIEEGLTKLPGWQRDGGAITKTYKLASFPAAINFVAAVAHLAETANHHPDIVVKYKRVTLTLSTHAEGGLTGRDFALAGLIERLFDVSALEASGS
jgi:4a-hydroxytetrahydrobiopterin dehydratase